MEGHPLSVEDAQAILTFLGTLGIIAGGFLLMVGGLMPSARAWAVRFLLVGALFAGAAALVTPEWLP